MIQFFNDRPFGEATGFIWKRRDRFNLITNWHVEYIDEIIDAGTRDT